VGDSRTGTATAERVEGEKPMVNFALRPISHMAAWLVWHSTHISLLSDLDAPAPPHERARRGKAA
jgi:hypothetical protein